MKKHIHIFVLSLLACVSCQERHPALFDDICGVYFRNLSATMSVVDTAEVTFAYEKGDAVEFPVRVQLLGRAAGHDRRIDVAVRSENAVEGVDYELPQQAYVPAGESYADYVVTLKRTPELKNERKTIELELYENEYFTLPVKELEQVSDTVSTLIFRIHFSDMFLQAPVTWDANLVGTFSQQKFELICRVLDIDPDDFNDRSKMTLPKLLYISTEMTYYVKAQAGLKAEGKPYDEDAFDPVTGQPLVFTKSV